MCRENLPRIALGATLLEVMLILAISTTVMMITFQEYETQRYQAEIDLVKYNVETIFQGMARYYYANCRNLYASTSNPAAATLDPSYASAPVAVALSAIGINASTLQVTSLLNGHGIVNSDYVLQFNPVTSTTRNINPCTNLSAGAPRSCSAQALLNNATVVTWRAQVSVYLRTNLPASFYQKVLGADCVSSLSGNTVLACGTGTAQGYLVWSRPPSAATQASGSELWQSLLRVQQFTRLYTNDDLYLYANPTAVGQTNPYYYSYNTYTCGG